ncbi:site-specific integrase [Streptomyces sp. NPDC014995]|uniref:site-specific integrase n=1 Tax=Streptomyces sp. NPDC014995 TaxID=3364936 RepID=UPI0036FDA0F9
MKPIKKGALAVNRRVFWVPPDAVRGGVRAGVVEGWDNLPSLEDAVGEMADDPVLLSPHHRVDPLLSLYCQSGTFRRYEEETRRNYVTDITLLLTFLWKRGRGWLETTPSDLEDYEHWRRRTEGNPNRVGGSKWGREPAAFASLFRWAIREEVAFTDSPSVPVGPDL